MGKLEVACFNAESALRAAACGAHRIELCSDRTLGGTTPPLALLKDLRSQIPGRIPINVMIRPRGGGFMYTEAEIDQMSSFIETLKPHCDGFVFGVLKTNMTIDVEACSRLVHLAKPLPCTFHRAFDETPDKLKSLEDVATCGFKTILTSGGPGNAIDNLEIIRQLLYATGCISPPVDSPTKIRGLALPGTIDVMAGGGIRSKDIAMLQQYSIRAEWYHTSAIVDYEEFANEAEIIACKNQAAQGA